MTGAIQHWRWGVNGTQKLQGDRLNDLDHWTRLRYFTDWSFPDYTFLLTESWGFQRNACNELRASFSMANGNSAHDGAAPLTELPPCQWLYSILRSALRRSTYLAPTPCCNGLSRTAVTHTRQRKHLLNYRCKDPGDEGLQAVVQSVSYLLNSSLNISTVLSIQAKQSDHTRIAEQLSSKSPARPYRY